MNTLHDLLSQRVREGEGDHLFALVALSWPRVAVLLGRCFFYFLTRSITGPSVPRSTRCSSKRGDIGEHQPAGGGSQEQATINPPQPQCPSP